MLGKLMPSRIKPLIIAAVLLLLSASASFALFGSNMIMSTSVAPTASGGGGGGTVACAVGPNAASTPANASLAGYTTCLFDMEPNAGGFWATTSNYITNCGASSSSVNTPSSWHFTVAQGFDGNPILSCPANVSVVTDTVGGTAQVLNLFRVSGTGGVSINWPNNYSNTQGYLSLGHYEKIVFRTDCATWYENGGSCTYTGSQQGEVAAWSSMANTLPFVDEDMWETIYGIAGLSGPGWCSYDGYHTGQANDGGIGTSGKSLCYGAGAMSPTVDMTQYHTLEFLWTNNGSGASSIVLCNWIDGTFTACLNDSPPTGGANIFTDRSRTMYINANRLGGGNSPTNYNLWIKSWQVWACPSVASAVCSGSTLVNGPPPALTYWH